MYVIEGNTSYTIEELLAILVERHETNKLQRTFKLQNARGEMGSILKIKIANQYICRRTGHQDRF
jgi:hypothetical protein